MSGIFSRTVHVLAVIVVMVILVALLSRSRVSPETTSIAIGTGSIHGLYYPVAGTIARLLNRKEELYGFRSLVVATEGSVENLNSLLAGDLQLALVQADIVFQAVHGQGEWYIRGPQQDLRSVCALHEEMVTLIASEASGITSLDDLRGKHVDIGAKGTGQRKNAIDILSAAEIDWRFDLRVSENRAEDAVHLLLEGSVDAMFYTVGHPNDLVEDATEGKRRVRLIPLSAEKLVTAHPYFHAATIPVDSYPGLRDREAVPTVGLTAQLVSSVEVPERFIYATALNLFENTTELRRLHPVFEAVTAQSMMHEPMAPLHDGVKRYLRQSGFMTLLEQLQPP